MSDLAPVIQFPHPGGEWGPRHPGGTIRTWTNTDEGHARKFLGHSGSYLNLAGEAGHGDICFWGEWEANSSLEAVTDPMPPAPSWVHTPLGGTADQPAQPQNTDPFVFGAFLYSLCRQPTHPSLRHLPPGTVILFGSTVHGRFCLDTVLVVRESHPHTPHTWPAVLEGLGDVVPAAYPDVALRPWYSQDGSPSTLYLGATHSAAVDGMFSFVPCRTRRTGEYTFPRPVISLPNLNPKNWRSHKVIATEDGRGRRRLWQSVVERVIDVGLQLAVAIDEVPWPTGADSTATTPSRPAGRRSC